LRAGGFVLENYPNPFNPSTTIRYGVDRQGLVVLSVHDVLGRKVAVLVDGFISPGIESVVWDATDMPSGVYFYRLTTEKGVIRKMMILEK